MSVIDSAVAYMNAVAADSSHGYDQANRWGPDYDCSSLVITAWQQAGVPVKDAGATYTGNMLSAFLTCGFEDVTGQVSLGTGGGLQAGDVLLNVRSHTAMYMGGGRIAQASINERGGITGGQSGDQTGGEINVRSYYNFPWDYVLRYADVGEAAPATQVLNKTVCAVTLPELRIGALGEAVRAMQTLLLLRGCDLPVYGVDGDFGSETAAAVRALQQAKGMEADGVVGEKTWEALIG